MFKSSELCEPIILAVAFPVIFFLIAIQLPIITLETVPWLYGQP
jgi:hypothetical protein